MMSDTKRSNVLLLLSGFLSLAVAMGIGRFAYTPIFPYMEVEALLSPFSAGLLATYNYVGYFIGALGARYVPQNVKWLYIGLAVNISTTLLMGLSENYIVWSCLRLLSGITSGLVFVVVSNVILSRLNQTEKMNHSGFLYGGVGFGILLSGLSIPAIQSHFGWEGNWLVLGMLSLMFLLVIILGMKGQEDQGENRRSKGVSLSGKTKFKRTRYALYVSYTLEGFGYIIFGTFITAMLANNEHFRFEPAYVWAIVGLGAIPSCLFWSWLGEKRTNRLALKWAYFAQIVSILIPILTNNLAFILLSAFGFGATFMGITTLTMNIAKLTDPGSNLVSELTAAYALGQFVGPVIAGTAISRNDYVLPFLISAVVLAMAFMTINFIKSEKGDIRHAIRKH